MARYRFVEHLVVADRRLQRRVPVDQPFAAVDELVLEEAEERVADRPGADRIEREPRPLPVAATAHLFELADDAPFVGLLPIPDPLHQPFASQLVPRLVFFQEQPPLDHGLSGDSRMIGAGHPEGLEALHPLLPDQHVLERVVQGVPEVQSAGHVRRRDDDRIRLPVGIRLAVKVASLLPESVPAILGRGVIVLLGQVHGSG